MPIVKTTYKPSLVFRNGYVSTVYSGLYRKSPFVNQTRERITLSDDDFLDLDWSYAKTKTDKLIIVLHGLEGNAQRPYMLGVADLFNINNVDALCVNFRGCSGEDNRNYRSYHSGATEDLHEVIQHVLALNKYNQIYINGFSLGGNLTLKYLGERSILPKEIKAAVAVSVPCDLYGSCKELHKLKNRPYADMFLSNLKEKLYRKLKTYSDKLSEETIESIKTLRHFDEIYTSQAHGFNDALDYYTKSSSLQFLENIEIPTLLINAKNDSFLSKSCFPFSIAKKSKNFFLETTEYGGHVGFVDADNVYYNEKRALEFLTQIF